MTVKSLYMNNFTFSFQNLTCILDANQSHPTSNDPISVRYWMKRNGG